MTDQSAAMAENPTERTRDIFTKMDVNSDGVLSKEEFIKGCLNDETLYRLLACSSEELQWACWRYRMKLLIIHISLGVHLAQTVKSFLKSYIALQIWIRLISTRWRKTDCNKIIRNIMFMLPYIGYIQLSIHINEAATREFAGHCCIRHRLYGFLCIRGW